MAGLLRLLGWFLDNTSRVFKDPSDPTSSLGNWETRFQPLKPTTNTSANMGASRSEKEAYFVKLRELIETYRMSRSDLQLVGSLRLPGLSVL